MNADLKQTYYTCAEQNVFQCFAAIIAVEKVCIFHSFSKVALHPLSMDYITLAVHLKVKSDFGLCYRQDDQTVVKNHFCAVPVSSIIGMSDYCRLLKLLTIKIVFSSSEDLLCENL